MPASVDSEIVLFEGATGTEVKRATGTGIVRIDSGVLSIDTSLATDAEVTAAIAAAIAAAVPAPAYLATMHYATINNSSVAPGANDAVFHRIDVPVAKIVTKIAVINGSSVAGNIDIGLRRYDGTNLVELGGSGPIAQTGAYVRQEFTFASPIALAAGDIVYAYYAVSSGSARFTGSILINTVPGDRTIIGGCLIKPSSFPVTGTAAIARAGLSSAQNAAMMVLE